MSREEFITLFDSSFIDLVTEKPLEDYNFGYTAGLLYIGLITGLITHREYKFLLDARYCIL